MGKELEIRQYNVEYETMLFEFLEKCLPESGRQLELDGRHSCYKSIDTYYQAFWCMFDGSRMVGVVAVRKMDEKRCELKSLFLLEKYHGKGHGKALLQKGVDYAIEHGYEKMYLDSFSTSIKAVGLYRSFGFVDTERYNQNKRADVFMVLDLKKG